MLYAADIQTNNSRLGNYNNLDIYLSVLHDRYTEEGNFKKADPTMNRANSSPTCFNLIFIILIF